MCFSNNKLFFQTVQVMHSLIFIIEISSQEKGGKHDESSTSCLCRRCEANFRESGYLLAKKGWQETKENCDFCGTRQEFIYSALQNKQIPVSKVSI